MTDIVERLRQGAGHHQEDIFSAERTMDEAADEIERLRELFRLDGEQHAARIKEIQHEQDTRLAAYQAEIERLTTENWQLKQACGYPIPADKETIDNPFKCGICDARRLAEPRAIERLQRCPPR